MGEAKRRKRLDPNFGKDDLQVEFLENNSQEYKILLENEAVKSISSKMTLFYLLKVKSLRERFEFTCIGHPIVQGNIVNCELIGLLPKDSKVRSWFDRHKKKIQKLVSQKAADEIKDSHVVIIQSNT